MDRIDQFIVTSNVYCAAHGLSRSRLSTLILGSGVRIDRIEAGADIGSRTLSRAMQWLSDNWPVGTDWPAEIERPALSRPDQPGEGASANPAPALAPSGAGR
jgi:hypothetical protein